MSEALLALLVQIRDHNVCVEFPPKKHWFYIKIQLSFFLLLTKYPYIN